MLIGLAALDSTDWSRLHHAYGRATDTPDQLHALLREDSDSREQAMEHLWSAVIHQGTPWTATGPAALVVAGLLSDPRLDRGHPIRANLLAFLVAVAEAPACAGIEMEDLEEMASFDIEPFLDSTDDEALYQNEQACNSFHARALLGCIRAAPVLMSVMMDGLSSPDPQIRAHAGMGAVALSKTPSLRTHSSAVKAKLLALTLTKAANDSDERSAHVLALGDLGESPTLFLDDPSPAVRLCAALAPGLKNHPSAIDELLRALTLHAGDIDGWFTERPPQFDARPRFAVVARLVEQVRDFDRLLGAAIATVAVSSAILVDADWGPLLVAAFPDGTGVVKTGAQRKFLEALVNRAELWNPRIGNAIKWFKKAGLPHDRAQCAARL